MVDSTLYSLIWLLGVLLIKNNSLVFSWGALFLLGTICFLKHEKSISTSIFLIGIIICTFVHATIKNPIGAIVGLVTCLLILYLPEIKSKYLKKLGVISYSLYLIHVPIGGRVVNLLERFTTNSIIRILILLLAFIISVCVAYLLYIGVEKGSHKLSRKYSSKKIDS